MTREVYQGLANDLKKEYDLATRNLKIQFAKEARAFESGDIINKNGLIIKVESFGCSAFWGDPEPVYKGALLRKDLMPYKNNSSEVIIGNVGTTLVKKANT